MSAIVHVGDCLEVMRGMPDASAQCCVTSPPYFGLRDYGHPGQIGLEPTPDAFVEKMVAVFREVRRVLRDDGTLWLNLGDSYASKSLLGIPWRVAFALQADGWWLRQDIIWHKPNPMPESIKDRCTKAHEYIFLLSKSDRYRFDGNSILEPFADDRNGNPGTYNAKLAKAGKETLGRHGVGVTGNGWNADGSASGRNKRSVWTVPSAAFSGAHFATFPPDLIRPCILAGCPADGVVLDPFTGSGTTGVVCVQEGRQFVGCELNPEYAAMARRRITDEAPLFVTAKEGKA